MASAVRALLPRQSPDNTDEFLNLLSDPFSTEIQANSIYAALVWSFAVSGGLFALFILLRPRNSAVYAPRAKHADEKHAPLPLEKKPFSWIKAITHVPEQELVKKIGLDAVIFLRFIRMLRNVFLVFSIIGLGIFIPLNVVGGHPAYDSYGDVATLLKFTPQYIYGDKFWAYVICAYVFQIILCGFIWWNYRAVLTLKRAWFNSSDYQSSLHSRTLLLTHVPKKLQSDSGLVEIIDKMKASDDSPRTAIARNVHNLPQLIEEHDEAVQQLEGHLATYLADPSKLPEKRPTCTPAKKDRKLLAGGEKKIDAIDYLSVKIKKLSFEIYEARQAVDRRDVMPYGFASFPHIEDAHSVAHYARTHRKKGKDANVRLAPKPNDLLWQNLPMSRATRRSRAFWDG
ncbi:hypothetical protein LTS18_005024, partial [Coniosporium uncinatum]